MKQMLKIEMERALKGAAFKIALIMGMIIVTVQFVKVGLHNALNPLEFFEYGGLTLPYTVIYTWIGGSFNVYYTLYIRSVSYTHLDVYKRQLRKCITLIRIFTDIS